jgi:hypothetical protein
MYGIHWPFSTSPKVALNPLNSESDSIASKVNLSVVYDRMQLRQVIAWSSAWTATHPHPPGPQQFVSFVWHANPALDFVFVLDPKYHYWYCAFQRDWVFADVFEGASWRVLL